jgi:hypothetical protein
MNISVETSPAMAKYWSELAKLSNHDKQSLIVLLTSSLRSEAASFVDEEERRRVSNAKLDAALAKFHSDWGGDREPLEIANELRQGPEMLRDVEVW